MKAASRAPAAAARPAIHSEASRRMRSQPVIVTADRNGSEVDSATLSAVGGSPPTGEVTLEMLAATFDEWRIFEAGGRVFAFRSGVGFDPAGPHSLLRPALTARSADELAELLCMQARYRLMSDAKLREAWLAHIGAGGVPGEIVAGSSVDPAARLETWLAEHPGATISQPSPPHLGIRVMVDGVIIAFVYGDTEALMSQLAIAEAVSACPRHPRAEPPAARATPSGGAPS